MIVEHESQKAILIGKGGALVKRIGSGPGRRSRRSSGARVFLDLRVKVRRRWRRDERYVERLLRRDDRSPSQATLSSFSHVGAVIPLGQSAA